MQEMLIIDKQFKDRDKPNPLPADVYKTFTIKIFDSSGYPIRYIELIDAHIRFSRERFKASPKKNGEQTASMTIKMQVLSAIQRINGKGLNVYRWHESNYKEDIYKPIVLAANYIEKQKQLRKYQIDQLGYISLCDGKIENVGEYDILMNQKGNEIKIYDTSILPELEKIKKVSIYKYNQSKKALSFSIKKAKSQDDLFNIFKFASDNSLVEWSIARTHNSFALGTYHNPIVSPGYSGVGFDIKNIISEVHSHPNIKANDFDELDSAGGDKGRYYNLSKPFLYYIYFPESGNLKNLYPDKQTHTVGFRQIRKITSHKDFYFGTLNSK